MSQYTAVVLILSVSTVIKSTDPTTATIRSVLIFDTSSSTMIVVVVVLLLLLPLLLFMNLNALKLANSSSHANL